MLSVSSNESLRARATAALRDCGHDPSIGIDNNGDGNGNGNNNGAVTATTPITGGVLAVLAEPTGAAIDATVAQAEAAADMWRSAPMQMRASVVRRLGELVRQHHDELTELIAIETGKPCAEALAEVHMAVAACESALGISRQLASATTAPNPGQRMTQRWHPIGTTAVITPFNLPIAAWCSNAALALLSGNPVIWKPSDRAVLTALGASALARTALQDLGAHVGVHQILPGGDHVGAALATDERISLVCATGSTKTGREVASVVSARLARSLLHLGANSAAIVAPSADVTRAAHMIAASATAASGQRCTGLRRLIVHRSVREQVLDQLGLIYGQLVIGDPRRVETQLGPLIDVEAFDEMQSALTTARIKGGVCIAGGDRVFSELAADARYVRPAIVTVPSQLEIVKHETLAPILWVMTYDDFDEAIALNNDVPYGLASAMFTNDLREAERFVSTSGSTCSIANINVAPSESESGAATGHPWTRYVRRASNTVDYAG